VSVSNSPAKSLVLGRIRDILGERPPAAEEYAAIAREYRQSASLPRAECLALLADRLAHYQVGVHACSRASLSQTIGDAVIRRGKRRLIAPIDLPAEWLPPGLDVVRDTGISYTYLDALDGVITGCTAAIAATGTIVLTHAKGEGRRALTLVPDYHLCVVFADQVVETVPEAIRRLEQLAPRLVTTISGPSATSDIEMTRIRGVHGPRTMDVVIAE
jgi:L-lactate dehydrogenase complex protein LldG